MKDFAKSIYVGNSNKVGNIAADITSDGNTWFVTTSDGKKKEFTSEREAEEYAKKVRTGNSKVGNAIKYTNLEEAKKMCQQMNDSLAPDAALRHVLHVYEKDGIYYVMETGEAVAKGMKRVGNSKVGNVIKKFGMGSLVIADGHKAVVFKETVEQGPNGIPFGWVTVRFVEGPWKGQTDEYYDYDLKKA